MQRIILHIDMNSYFASVEQQARPALCGKPIGVTGSSKKRTIIVAASVEAKQFGVKTGTQLHEAKQLCPQIVLVTADCNRYESITRQFLNIFISKTPLVEIFSIDEAFLNVSDQVGSFHAAEELAKEIKNEIKMKIGANVRCSIGIAQNKLVAKLASEVRKPDGLTAVLPGQEVEFLDQLELTDACGIGSRIYRRLATLGVNSFSDLRGMDQTALTLIFNSYGLRLYNIARGVDFDPIHPYYERLAPKSISRSKTLQANTQSLDLVKQLILSFCENIGCELREKKLLAGSAGVYLRYGDFTWAGRGRRIKSSTNLTCAIYQAAKLALSRIAIKKQVRKIGVWVGGLTKDNGQLFLDCGFARTLVLDQTADRINKKYGMIAVKRSSLARLDFSGRSPNFGFKKDYELG